MELFKGASGRRTCIIIITAAAILMYLGSISGDFMRDDLDLIIENARIRSLANVPTIFLTGFIPAGRAEGGGKRAIRMLHQLKVIIKLKAKPVH